ncbi:ATP-binding cassette domain-containing protein [Variovorax sp. J22P168]|uniref:ABC transporter ATP-binding protein n=1 Tax=Variovorax jilinensis TaxID=3053513 RepID=UPI002577BD39|nr:ATP-binding cassette domain-containing protein [Variovorax sp. J22P168]MDM0014463.1 ATP-binding cassette domain-containing protein [Variovorax sp. J22P168]
MTGAAQDEVDAAPLLQVKALQFAYPGEPPLFAGWNAAIGPGLTLLHGDTGSGKSTLLRLLAGGAAPQHGELLVGAVALAADAAAYRRRVFHVDPSTDEFDALAVADCTAALKAGDEGFDESAWQALVEGFSLAPHLGKSMFMLSTGSKRKVWLAAALASSRPLLLLDEPTAALDTGSIRCLWRALEAKARAARQAVVVASYERPEGLSLAQIIELPAR